MTGLWGSSLAKWLLEFLGIPRNKGVNFHGKFGLGIPRNFQEYLRITGNFKQKFEANDIK